MWGLWDYETYKEINSYEKWETLFCEDEAIIFDIPKGYYEVSIYLIAWEEEPKAYLKDGSINPKALSDFVVMLKSNADERQSYRQRINTFSVDD